MKNTKRNDRPVCPFNHTDCFAWMKNNRCYCLNDTDFKGSKDCPFYKNDPDTLSPALMAAKYKEEKTL